MNLSVAALAEELQNSVVSQDLQVLSHLVSYVQVLGVKGGQLFF